jgi:hypothetical protein
MCVNTPTADPASGVMSFPAIRACRSSDPFPYYERELERSFEPTCACAQVKNAYRQHCLLRTSSTVELGSPERHAEILSTSEG